MLHTQLKCRNSKSPPCLIHHTPSKPDAMEVAPNSPPQGKQSHASSVQTRPGKVRNMQITPLVVKKPEQNATLFTTPLYYSLVSTRPPQRIAIPAKTLNASNSNIKTEDILLRRMRSHPTTSPLHTCSLPDPGRDLHIKQQIKKTPNSKLNISKQSQRRNNNSSSSTEAPMLPAPRFLSDTRYKL